MFQFRIYFFFYTGLDPALPGFTLDKPTLRLDAADAVFVDCIHTCAGFLGIDEAICSADYYPNYGKNQPGCHWFDLGQFSILPDKQFLLPVSCPKVPNFGRAVKKRLWA